MGSLEKTIYNLLKDRTGVKKTVKKAYQIFFLLHKPERVVCKYDFAIAEGYFFGFHDKSPWNSSGKYILAHKVPGDGSKAPAPDEECGIGLFGPGFDAEKFHILSKTKCWNWQQGSMLQWVGKKNWLIFNDLDGDRIVSKLLDLEGNLINQFPYACGAVSPDGRLMVSFSFERLNRGMPGYGYAKEEKDFYLHDSDIPLNSGFSVFNMQSLQESGRLSVAEINDSLGAGKFDAGYVFVTHFLFSPDSRRILFLLRKYVKGRRLVSRLITCNIDGSELFLLPTGNMVSHLSWVGNKEILAYCSDQQDEDAYYLFRDRSSEYKKIGGDSYSYDGHPQYNIVRQEFVTDSYPDRKRLQELSIFNIIENKKNVVGWFYSPLRFSNELRCDLHPRWNRTGDKICIDTTFTGKRSLCVINIGNI